MLKILYAQSCLAKEEKEKAQQLLHDAYMLDPKSIKINEAIAAVYHMMGLTKETAEHLDIILKNDPLNTKAMLFKSSIHTYSYGDDDFKKLDFAAAHITNFSVREKLQLHYALAKANDNVGDYATAFEHYRLGGVLNSEGRHHRELSDLQRIASFIGKAETKALLMEEFDKGCFSKKPIFVVGMPRSGTSLIEQVLSNIEGVYGAGELEYAVSLLHNINFEGFKLTFVDSRDCFPENQHPSYLERGEKYLELIEALAPKGTKRIIDKSPTNFAWLGYLHLILPNAKFIHSRRHPVETCLSAYRIHFAKGQYWSDDLRTMGKFYRLYTEVMDYWKEILPEGTILDVRYEDVVADLENQSKRMAAYIDMPWSEACLDFHQSKRAVRTASVSQVRQPIYTTSVNRWHKYEPYLKPLLDEIGDLVEAYEKELGGS
jgi:tetratricopeptide (TPR) repeat protein